MTADTFLLKNDAYRKARGNYSRFFTIFCASCNKPLCLYQKDGHEYLLKRMYVDRILAPISMTDLAAKELQCPQCHAILGVRYIYEKENRPAFLLKKGSFVKKVTKGVFAA